MITKDYSFLLDRPEHTFDDEAIDNALKNKRVMVTGAGGSIGSALVLRILKTNPSTALILVGHGEGSLFELRQQIAELKLGPRKIHYCVGNVRSDSVTQYLNQDVDIVFHAAAHKHVQLMEENPVAAYDNNTLQTIWLGRQCNSRNIKLVFISTDKAVNPTTIMGASKRLAEAWIESNMSNATVCRFGNVLGSAGSLVPIIERRVAAGLPIEITDASALRYFITAKEAVGLVLTAGLLFEPGKYSLEMGNPVPIVTLAWKLAGRNYPIELTGLKSGEKLHEELKKGRLFKTSHPEICGILEPVHASLVRAVLEIIEDVANSDHYIGQLIVEMANKL